MSPNIGIPRRGGAAITLLVSSLALSCGGGGGSSGGVMPPPIQPTLASIQTNVFSPRCALSGCHGGASPQQGMNLSSGQAFANIVNVASVELPAFKRVNPGNAVDSYLFMKITGDARISGVRMPASGGVLSAEQIAAIRDWINAGATP